MYRNAILLIGVNIRGNEQSVHRVHFTCVILIAILIILITLVVANDFEHKNVT